VLVNVTGGAPGRTDRSRPAGIIGTSDWADLVDELDAQPGDQRQQGRSDPLHHPRGDRRPGPTARPPEMPAATNTTRPTRYSLALP